MRLCILALWLLALPVSAEVFLDIGFNASRIESDIANAAGITETSTSGVHLGLGARRHVTERSDLSFRIELDDVDSDLLLAVRALDYRFNFSETWAVTMFVGAARLDLATPAYGYYLGAGVQRKQLFDNWDLTLDLRYGDKLARDNLLPSDPQGGRPDNFYDVTGVSLYLSYRF
jgi:hypothetical protein